MKSITTIIQIFIFMFYIIFICSSCSTRGALIIKQSEKSIGIRTEDTTYPYTRLYYCTNNICKYIIEYADKGSFFATDASQYLTIFIIDNLNTKNLQLFYINSQCYTDVGYGSFKTYNAENHNAITTINAIADASTIYSQRTVNYNFTFNFIELDINQTTKDNIYSKINDEFTSNLLKQYFPEYLNGIANDTQ